MKFHHLFLAAMVFSSLQATAAESPQPVLDSPIFPFTYRPMPDNDARLAELGYSNFQSVWTSINLSKEPPVPASLEQNLRRRAAKGAGVLWLSVTWPEDTPANREAMAAHIRKLADLAAELGWITSIYPHTGDSLFTLSQTLPFVGQVAHPNVGVTLNLAHELRNGQREHLLDAIQEAGKHLNAVSINGSVDPGAGTVYDWKALIQPLGRGDFDLLPVLRKLREVGYTGPIGVQCHNIEGDTAEILAESIRGWNDLRQALKAK